MSNNITNGFDPYELIELLERRGVSHPAALVLVCLLERGPNDSSGLQNSCGIRQPEVSIGVAELRELGIIEIEAVRKNGRGRPRHLYSLFGGIYETLEPILLRARKKLDNLTLQIGKLEQIAAGFS
jgi:predicted transcriptional regulator